ncbi:MAG: ATP-binding cassette domain-containing protein [Clostridium sp.]
MIKVNNISMEIDENIILNDMNFNIEAGTIVGLVGPNGVGKTTLIKCLTGIYENTKGEILYDGQRVYDNEVTKKKISYVADENQFFSSYKVKHIIKFYELAYGFINHDKLARINKLFEINLNKRLFQLSKGQKMRVFLLIALCQDTEYLILDEPTSGLDPIIKNGLLKLLLKEKSAGRTIIMSSHHLLDLEKICDSIIFIKNGEITNNSTLKDLKNKVKKIQVAFDAPTYEEDLFYDGVIKITKVGKVFTIVTNNYCDEFNNKLLNLKPILIDEIELSLEDIFIHEVGGDDIYEEIFK